MHLITNLYIFMTALFAALLMVPLLHKWALGTGAVDLPDARKIHEQPVPRIGGIAIFIALLFSSLIYSDICREVRGLFAGGLVLFFIGLIDDLYGLSARRKLYGQIGSCCIAIGVGHLYVANLGDLFGFGAIVLPLWLAVPFTLFAMIGIINAINLIDGLDGLAGGVSVVALSAFFLLALLDGNFTVMALCAGLIGALLGFLKFNFYPARIFMGDAGSLVVGFFLGFIAILLTQGASSQVRPIIPVMILGLPIIDTLWVMGRRMVERNGIFSADMTHVHHKFLSLGFQHRFTVLVIYGISFFWAIFSIAGARLPDYVLLAAFLGITLGNYALLRHLELNKGRYAFWSHDSARGLRDSATYRRIAERFDGILPILFVLLLGYFVLASLVSWQVAPPGLWKWAGALFVSGLGLLVLTRDTRSHYLQTLLYFTALVITYAVESGGERLLLAEMTVSQFTSTLFWAVALMVLLKAFFRKEGEFFIATVDFLTLGISIVLAVFFYQTRHLFDFAEPFLKGIVLFLAIKLLIIQNRFSSGLIIGGALGVLLLVAVSSYRM